jgi:SNF2 family DNA or RNA helicase
MVLPSGQQFMEHTGGVPVSVEQAVPSAGDTLPVIPRPNELVFVRQRRYLVEDVIPSQDGRESTLVSMACVDDDAQGQSLEVLWEHEIDAQVLRAEAWDTLAQKGFDQPAMFSAYIHTLRWNCVTATDPKLFQSPFRAGIKVDAYQLEPLRKALKLPRVTLFIADDVGLGKTIEAGLIARELILRRKVREIVVVCPPSMIQQWKDEMEQRFGLTFEVYDRNFVARMRQERGYGVNPWTTHSRFLISDCLVTDEAYAAPMRDWLGEMRSGTLLILDEAHHAAPASGSKYAIDSKITKVVRDLAGRFEHRLFLSATPHNGHSNSFSALLEILDPMRFCRGVKVPRSALDEVMVRRLKEDLRGLDEAFPHRRIEQVDISGLPEDAPELELARLLDTYRRLREQRLQGAGKRVQNVSALLLTGLQKRLLSSIEAFAKTLRVHRRTVENHAAEIRKDLLTEATSPMNLDLVRATVDADDERSQWNEEALDAAENAQIEAASRIAAGSATGPRADLFEQELALLQRMADLAEEHRAQPDARVRKLLVWMATHQCPGLMEPGGGGPWTDTRILIFTEYEDTRRYLVNQIRTAIGSTDLAADRMMVFSGMTSSEDRETIKRAFNADPKVHPVRILVATDAAREGLNLQSHCRDLFHFDVPWNPCRMEQRNGRIDRKLQPAKEVVCRYFFYRQRPEDQILQTLVRKTKTIREELGSLSQVLESRLDALLHRSGIRREHLADLQRDLEAEDLDGDVRAVVAEEFEEDRRDRDAQARRRKDLADQIAGLRKGIDAARKHIGLEESHFRAALNCSLRLLKAEPLEELPPAPGDPYHLQRYLFPRLDLQRGADTNWAPTMDTLRAPRPKAQRQWDWRREAPIRPVIFEDPGVLDDQVVHLHLEQRMVQRLLGRFTAQGFVHHDLSRACFAHTHDAFPRVILLGRLSMFGPGAVRLHEELVPVTARWEEPISRRGPLKPYGREAEARTLALLEESLGDARPRAIAEERLATLQHTAPRDIQDLLEPLQDRGKAFAEDARRSLRQRGQEESTAMREILLLQKQRIQTALRKAEAGGNVLKGLDGEEIRQLRADQNHWRQRLGKIDHELDTEPHRVEQHYDVKVWRIEPVGLVYLWPVTG